MQSYSREEIAKHFGDRRGADLLAAIARRLGCQLSYCELDVIGPRAPKAR